MFPEALTKKIPTIFNQNVKSETTLLMGRPNIRHSSFKYSGLQSFQILQLTITNKSEVSN